MRQADRLKRLSTLSLMALTFAAASAAAQAPVPPPAPSPTPDDTPTIRIGAVIFANYTYTDLPAAKDDDGNSIHPNAFEISRAYINLTGNLHHLVSFRVTPDVAGRMTTNLSRGTAGEAASTNYDGNLIFRLKYAFGQLNLDDWLPKGSWVRIGQQQTPYVDFMESIYRYRFQGATFADREGFLTSSDVGFAGRFALPGNYGDIHAGIYNGDGYSKAEANDRKAFQIRGTLRPAPNKPVWKGLRVTAFYDADKYIKAGARDRFIASATFEHTRLNLGLEALKARDKISEAAPQVEAEGLALWIRARAQNGLEGLFRYDRLKPNGSVEAKKKRTLAGIAYWLKSQGSAQTAVFANIEKVNYDLPLAKPNERRLAASCLFSF